MTVMEKTQHEQSVFQAILARRSVRSFTPKTLEKTTIQTLLEAAVRAPTAMHQEPWAFIVIQDKPSLKRVSDVAKPMFLERLHHSHLAGAQVINTFTNPDLNIFHDAGTLIVICAKLPGPFVEADCWLAAENLMLAACALGLGSCVVGSAQAALNTPIIKTELGIPPEFTAIAPIVVGVPRGETPSTPRKMPLVLSWKQPGN